MTKAQFKFRDQLTSHLSTISMVGMYKVFCGKLEINIDLCDCTLSQDEIIEVTDSIYQYDKGMTPNSFVISGIEVALIGKNITQNA